MGDYEKPTLSKGDGKVIVKVNPALPLSQLSRNEREGQRRAKCWLNSVTFAYFTFSPRSTPHVLLLQDDIDQGFRIEPVRSFDLLPKLKKRRFVISFLLFPLPLEWTSCRDKESILYLPAHRLSSESSSVVRSKRLVNQTTKSGMKCAFSLCSLFLSPLLIGAHWVWCEQIRVGYWRCLCWIHCNSRFNDCSKAWARDMGSSCCSYGELVDRFPRYLSSLSLSSSSSSSQTLELTVVLILWVNSSLHDFRNAKRSIGTRSRWSFGSRNRRYSTRESIRSVSPLLSLSLNLFPLMRMFRFAHCIVSSWSLLLVLMRKSNLLNNTELKESITKLKTLLTK